jgi:hypothetical protein
VAEPPDDRFVTKAKINRAYADPDAPLIMDLYRDRPAKLAEVKACAEAWERLKAAAGAPSIYASDRARRDQ